MSAWNILWIAIFAVFLWEFVKMVMRYAAPQKPQAQSPTKKQIEALNERAARLRQSLSTVGVSYAGNNAFDGHSDGFREIKEVTWEYRRLLELLEIDSERLQRYREFAGDVLCGMTKEHLHWNQGKPPEKWTICGHCDYGASIKGHSVDPRYDTRAEHSPTCILVEIVKDFEKYPEKREPDAVNEGGPSSAAV